MASDLAGKVYAEWGIVLTSRGGELHGACPFCGQGNDRFIVWPEGNYWCRVCETRGQVPGTAGMGRDALTAAIAEKKAKQVARLTEWQKGYQAGYIQGYHDRMAEEQKQYWRSEGITDESIDRYELGYCEGRTFEGTAGATFTSPAYTIPHRDPMSLQLVNCQYRIINLPPEAGGKYRQEPGLPPASFFTLPKVMSGSAIVVEGGKKAVVISQLVRRKLQVVGWPGITPSEDLYNQLEDFDVVWLCLDPGPARAKAVERAQDYLGDRIRIVTMPVKPDDAVVKHGMTGELFKTYLQQAR